MSRDPNTTEPVRAYPHEPERYGYGGGPLDCPHCGAIGPDYCPLVRCKLEEERGC